MLKTLIVDDEPAARRKLKGMLEKYDFIQIAGEAKDGQEAVEKINDLRPDLVFLDIQMPGKTGLDVAMETVDYDYRLIFVTAYDEYALKAFEAHAVDYLLKPVSAARLEKAISRLKDKDSAPPVNQLETLLQTLTQSRESDKIGIKNGASTMIINMDHLAYIEAEEGYSRVYLGKEGKMLHKIESILSDSSLDHFIKELKEDHFLRVHRATIVNMKQVKSYNADGRHLYLSLMDYPDKKITVSRSSAALVKSHWGVL